MTATDLLHAIARDIGLLPQHLSAIIKTAPLRYKEFDIPKKGGGSRRVAQPAREVKAVQRWLLPKLEKALPIHDAATGYRRGSSIRRNAELHVHNEYMLKMDIKNFFPSITFEDICLHLEMHCRDYFDEGASRLIAQACCWAKDRRPPLRLCIGAPSSPVISNSVMFSFDTTIANLTKADGIMYSRYADDITFSCNGKGRLGIYADLVNDVLGELPYPRLTVNRPKTLHLSRKGRRNITGVTITPKATLSIGRERKRLIRAMLHRQSKNELSGEEIQRLNGLIAFADFIEPGFKHRVRPDKSEN